MTEREKLIKELIKNTKLGQCFNHSSEIFGNISDFILAGRKRIFEPLINIINSDRKNNYDYLLNATYKVLDNAGVEP